MDLLQSFMPTDRRRAAAEGRPLPSRATGAVLVADLARFTPLAAAYARTLGPQRGAEELTRLLNQIYASLVDAIDHYGGSVLSFAGDAMTCWFPDDQGRQAVASGLAMQAAMPALAAQLYPTDPPQRLALKVAIAHGPVQRFQVGDPAIQLFDMLAGAPLARVAAIEHLVGAGEVVVAAPTVAGLTDSVVIVGWRGDPATLDRCAVITAGAAPVALPTLALPPLPTLPIAQLRPWLLPIVWERLRQGQAIFLAELRPAVALFLRFQGLEYDSDPAAAAQLDTYLRWAQGVLAAYGGALIDLTIGDKGSYLYASFGVPIAHTDDTLRAAAAALVLRTPPTTCPAIREVQIGLHQGEVWAGAYGGPTRRTYGALGDAINLAARLMQAAPPGTILATPAVQQATGTAFHWTGLPPIMVKGKETPIAVVALHTAASRTGRGLLEPAYRTPLVGRSAELAGLEAALDQTRRGAGQIRMVTGEAGLGKSRLLGVMIGRARAAAVTVLGGAAQSYGQQTAYLAWRSIGRGLFALDEAAGAAEAVAQMQTALAALDPALGLRAPLLGPVLGLDLPETALTAGMTGTLRQASLESLLVDCLRIWARATPLVLVVEDCHWLDPLSADLLVAVGRAIADSAILLLLATRPPDPAQDPLAPLTQLGHYGELPLAGLPASAARALVQARLGGAPALDELVTQIVVQAEGNPFYGEELVAYLEERALDLTDPAALAQFAWPPSLQWLLLARLDQLSETQRTVMKVASIIGRVFQADQLWGVYPDLGPRTQVLPALDALDRLGLTLLESPPAARTYLFKHASTLDVTYTSMPRRVRADLHAQYAAWLEAGQGGTHPGEQLDLLAYHYGQSTRQDKQREYYRKAGDAAAARYANAVAIRYYEQLLPLLDRDATVPVLLALAAVFDRTAAWEAAIARYEAARVAATAVQDAAGVTAAQYGLGCAYEHRRDLELARGWLEQARAGFIALGDGAGESRALVQLGTVAKRLDEIALAQGFYEQSAARARAVGDRLGLATALTALGDLISGRGDYTTARELLDTALTLQHELDDQAGIADIYNRQGIISLWIGEYHQAEALFREELALRQMLGDTIGTAMALNCLGISALDRGDLPAAQQLYTRVLTIAQQCGSQTVIAGTLHNLAEVALRQARFAEATVLQEESTAIYTALGSKVSIAFSRLGQGLVALLSGQYHTARERYRDGLQRYVELGRFHFEAELQALLGLAATMAAASPTPHDATHSARLLGTIAAAMAEHHYSLDVMSRQIYAQTEAIAQAQLGAPAFATAFAAGQARAWDVAVTDILAATA